MHARGARLLLEAGLVLGLSLGGCKRPPRPHLTVSPDAGPAVVVRSASSERAAPRVVGNGAELAPKEWADEREPNDDRASAQPLESGQGVRGGLAAHGVGERGDADWYRWTVTGGVTQTGDETAGGELPAMIGRVELKLRSADRVPADAARIGEPVVELFDAQSGQDKPLATGTVAGDRVVIADVTVVPLQAYLLRVRERPPKKRGAPQAARAALAYQLVVAAEIAEPGDMREPNDDAAHASLLALGSDAQGYFGRPQDEDWLRLPTDLSGDEVLRIELTPVPGVAAEVQVRDAANRIVSQARGVKGGEVRMRNAPAPAGGAVVLRARAGFDVDRRWRFRAMAEPALDGVEREPNDEVTTAQMLSVAADGPGQIAGFLWPGDADVYRLRAPSDAAAGWTLELAVPRGVEPHLDLLDAHGKIQATSERHETTARLRVDLPAAGEALLRVTGRSRDTSFDAPYTLSWVPADNASTSP